MGLRVCVFPNLNGREVVFEAGLIANFAGCFQLQSTLFALKSIH
jgi:hypothetical protein